MGHRPFACALLLVGTLGIGGLCGRPFAAFALDETSASSPLYEVKSVEFKRTVERPGVVRPAAATELRIELEAYAGELLLREITEHGTPVNKGDIVARLDTRGIEKQIEASEREAISARVRYEAAVERDQLENAAARSELDRARTAFARSERALKAYLEQELEYARRERELSNQNWNAGIDDQKEELAQLEAMYRADELVDATEEIVLKRSRRQLANTLASFQLYQDRQRLAVDVTEAHETASRQEAVDAQRAELARREERLAIDRRIAEDEIRKARQAAEDASERLEELQRDAAQFAIRAPQSGTLLHGAAREQLPNSLPAHWQPYASVPARAVFLTIANADAWEVAVEIPESLVTDLKPGTAVEVAAVDASAPRVIGTLRYKTYPAPRGAGAPESVFDGVVTFDRKLTGWVNGQRAKVSISMNAIANALVIPKRALVRSGGANFVYSSASSPTEGAKRCAVELGPEQGDEVVVKSGLVSGQKVLLWPPRE
ncbi:MAG: hypothetical protein ACKVX7_15455 [Planctomycetota bacterium]